MDRKQSKQSDRFKAKWLEWALNLPAINLEKIDVGKHHQLKSEAFFFCSCGFRSENENRYFEFLKGEGGLENYKRIEGSIDLSKLQDRLKQGREFIMNFSSHPYNKKFSLIYDLSMNLLKPNLEMNVDDEGERFHVEYKTTDPIHQGLMNFSKLIDNLPTDSIIECKGCKKSFVDLTKKKKMFCSSSCAARYTSRLWREDLKKNHPKKHKAYLKNQRERMKKIRSGIFIRTGVKKSTKLQNQKEN